MNLQAGSGRVFGAVVLAMGLAFGVALSPTVSAAEIDFHIVSPADGAVVSSPVKLKIAVEGTTIGKPSEGLDHLHYAVDGGEATPIYKNHVIELDLAPGKHSLWVNIAGPTHRPLMPAKTVTFTVK